MSPLFTNRSQKAPFSPFWLAIWSVGLALGWLLPNHYPPWLAFHFDVWIAAFLGLAALTVAVRSPGSVSLHRIALVVILVAPVPFLQYWLGLLPFAGQAWIGASFLIGLLLSLVLGSHWEAAAPCQAIDGLFMAIGLAGIASVGLQFFQWFGLSADALDLWIMEAPGSRPFANFIQPNQLATFLLWALLGCAWGLIRGKLGPAVAVLMAAYLLFGIALTQSRTAFVAVLTLAGASFFWRRYWRSKAVDWSIVGLLAYYLVCAAYVPAMAGALGFEEGLGLTAQGSVDLRLDAYRVLWDAAMQRPMFGYGWAQTAAAQLAVAENHPRLNGVFMQAHNLFLDLVLWCGIPLGGFLSLVLVGWLVAKARRVSSAQDAILVMFVAVVGWHAMLELPLHYAYMLLPTGLVMGVLNIRLGEPVVGTGRRWKFVAAVVAGLLLLVVITRDYLRIEENFFVLRFERARIDTRTAGPPASVWVLDHMNEFIRLGRTPVRKGMRVEELDSMHKASRAFPSAANMFTVATAFALNGKPEEAQKMVNQLSKISPSREYALMQRIWRAQARTDTVLDLVSWPQ